MKLLVVEDEVELNTLLSTFFRKQGNEVVSCHRLFDAEDALIGQTFDVILLDIGLPDGSGLNFLKSLKKNQDTTGLLILSAKNSLDDKIHGLELGADDYLTKPFHLAELNARVHAIVRRKVFKNQSEWVFEEITLSIEERIASVNRNALSLTKKEYELLQYFVVNQNRVLTKEALAEHLWGESVDNLENFDFIYTHIKNLRKKIEAVGGRDYLQTVHGIGYKFTRS